MRYAKREGGIGVSVCGLANSSLTLSRRTLWGFLQAELSPSIGEAGDRER